MKRLYGNHTDQNFANIAELKLMQETGFNSVRLILEYVVWEKEHDSFMERFE